MGDYDNDGDFDLLVPRFSTDTKLFRNDNGTFVDVTPAVFGTTRKGAIWIDFDLDADLDAYLVGHTTQYNRLLRNEGGGEFTDLSDGDVAITTPGDGVTWGDFDADGDPDIYVANFGANVLLDNNNPLDNKYFAVRLHGSAFYPNGMGTNKRGIGAKVRIVETAGNGFVQHREVRAGSGYLSQHPTMAYFGVLAGAAADTVEVVWPSTPFVTRLFNVPTNQTIDLFEPHMYASFTSVADVPNDNGGNMRLEWSASDLDVEDSPLPIHFYGVYRRIEPGLAPPADEARRDERGLQGAMGTKPEKHSDDGPAILKDNVDPAIVAAPAGWDFVMLVPATLDPTYTTVVPTLKDSTESEGQHYSVFMVRALTNTPGEFFDSPIDSGYTLDNVPPSPPSSVIAQYNQGSGTELSWQAPGEPDLDYFNVYRSDQPDFAIDPSNFMESTLSTSWTDPDIDPGAVFYKVSAVDDAGNESDGASPDQVTGITPDRLPARFALHQNHPNPFNPTTTIRYDVPAQAHVVIRVYDVSGSLVRTLVDEVSPPGRFEKVWDGLNDTGNSVASGIYFYRMETAGYSRTMKMVMLK